MSKRNEEDFQRKVMWSLGELKDMLDRLEVIFSTIDKLIDEELLNGGEEKVAKSGKKKKG